MNIFATSADPRACAQALDNKRLVKMCLETAQLVSTAFHELQGRDLGYKPTHVNHPCSIWARASYKNLEWLIAHWEYLCNEYRYRYEDKIHASYPMIEDAHKRIAGLLRDGWDVTGWEMTPFANCARNTTLGLDFTHVEDVHLAYRQYLSAKWQLTGASWRARKPPTWLVTHRIQHDGQQVSVPAS